MTDQMHTVAMTVRGTRARILVECLVGSRDQVLAAAAATVREFRSAHTVQAVIVETVDITDVPAIPFGDLNAP